MKGGYLPKDKVVAEKEFRLAVEAIKEKEDDNTKTWCENIIATEFRCIQTTETVAYWNSLSITGSNKDDINHMDALKFKIITASNYNKRSALPDTTSNPLRKHITITNNDGITLDGLNVSLFSHLKTVTVNKLHDFNNQSEREQYYATMTMNNVLDLSNRRDNTQMSSLSPQQVEELHNRFTFEEPPEHYVDSYKDNTEDKKSNIKHVLNFINN